MQKLIPWLSFGLIGFGVAVPIVIAAQSQAPQRDPIYYIPFNSVTKLSTDPDIDSSLPEGVKKAHESVAMITFQGSLGSTVHLGGSGVWVTNRHVVAAGSGQPVIRLHDGREIEGRVACVEPTSEDTRDVAIVLTEDPGVPPIKIRKDPPEVGSDIFANGSPFGRPEIITEGRVQSLDQGTVTDSDMIVSELEVNPGNSGGAALDKDGNLLGLITFKKKNLGIAIGSPVVLDVLSQVAKGEICQPGQESPRGGGGSGGGRMPRQMPGPFPGGGGMPGGGRMPRQMPGPFPGGGGMPGRGGF